MKPLYSTIKYWLVLPVLLLSVACSDSTNDPLASANSVENSTQSVATQPSSSVPDGESNSPESPVIAPQPSPPSAVPNFEPNMILNVNAESGTCPETVGLYSFGLGYEGGAEHIAIPDTLTIAHSPKVVSESEQSVKYEAQLSDRYSDCVGQAVSETPAAYTFDFREGKVFFTVDVASLNLPYAQITSSELLAMRPYIRWAVAD